MAERPLRIGLVGAGRMAEVAHAPAIRGSGEAALVAVADPDRGRAQGLARPARARVHASAEELLAAGGLDAVVVSSPAPDHPHSARLVAEAGLPCLVEKPPAPDARGACELASLEPAPWIGFNRRFAHPGLPERLPSPPLELRLRILYRRSSWRSHEVTDGPMLDLVPHLADLARWLSGSEVARVRAGSVRGTRAELALELGDGSVAELVADTGASHSELIEARGRDGSARVRLGGPVRGLVARLSPGPHPLLAWARRQLDAFCSAARGGDPGDLATARDGMAAMLAVEAALESAERSVPVAPGDIEAALAAGGEVRA
jgi:myo-inositol 2-dehydrogenase / D-chiro-inositol 1-dehydrogenase